MSLFKKKKQELRLSGGTILKLKLIPPNHTCFPPYQQQSHVGLGRLGSFNLAAGTVWKCDCGKTYILIGSADDYQWKLIPAEEA